MVIKLELLRVAETRDGKNPVDAKAREVKQLIVNDVWWDDLDYLLSFTKPIVDMLRAAHTDALVLHSIYDLWDTMIENVKAIIFEHEDKDHITRQPDFFDTIHEILEARWTKNNTSALHSSFLGGDRFDIDGSPIEFAELSINEPELELVTFDDAMEEVQLDDIDHDA
ncbi:hypothetical protein ACSBR2_031208 [Camellia fascicularis]